MAFETANRAPSPAAQQTIQPPADLRARLTLLIRDAIGYGAASALALAVDWSTLSVLVRVFDVNYLVAGAAGFSAGLVVAFVLSVAFVFKGRARYSARVEFAGFLVTGLIGLALNQALLAFFTGRLGVPADIAKAPTVGFVFAFNFLSRRLFLFAPSRS